MSTGIAEGAFAKRVALITGADGAIGSALVRVLRAQGAIVIGADASGSAGLDQVAPDLRESLRLDVTDAHQIRALVDAVEQKVGAVDLLVNVAGVVSFGSAESLAVAEWDRVIDINLRGTFLVCQAVIAGMKRKGFGRIVNIGSVVGKNAGNARPWIDPQEQERAGNIAYGVSKIGVHALTGFLAKELAAHGITVNAVAPGPIATAMTTNFPQSLRALLPVGRMGTTDDVTRAVLFLAAADAGFITGEVLDVNGGMWCD